MVRERSAGYPAEELRRKARAGPAAYGGSPLLRIGHYQAHVTLGRNPDRLGVLDGLWSRGRAAASEVLDCRPWPVEIAGGLHRIAYIRGNAIEGQGQVVGARNVLLHD